MKCCFDNREKHQCDALTTKKCEGCKSKCTTIEELDRRYKDIFNYSICTRNSHAARNNYETYKKRLEEQLSNEQ